MALKPKPMPDIAKMARAHPQDIRDFHKSLRDFLLANPEYQVRSNTLGRFYIRKESEKWFWRGNTLYRLPARDVVAMRVKSRSAVEEGLFSASNHLLLTFGGVVGFLQGGNAPTFRLSLGGVSENSYTFTEPEPDGEIRFEPSDKGNVGVMLACDVIGPNFANSQQIERAVLRFHVNRHGALFDLDYDALRSTGEQLISRLTIEPVLLYGGGDFLVDPQPTLLSEDWGQIHYAKLAAELMRSAAGVGS